MSYIFWVSSTFIIYTYIGYPLWLALLKRLRPLIVRKSYFEPTVSVVIAVHDEERNILNRVKNLLGQEYPPQKLELIIVSDGSNDRTVELLQELQLGCLKIIDLPINKGKAVALNTAVAVATGEIIVFTDARQTFAIDVVRQLAANFSDPEIGCVSGELLFLQDENSMIQAEMGAYWKYEKWIRKAESATGSVVGATGAIYAIRRSIYHPLPAGTILDDVLTPMQIVMNGYRTIFDGEVLLAYDIVSKDMNQEWKRKVRTLAGNWQLLSLSPVLLLPWLNHSWWRFIAHKLMRLLVPAMLCTLFVSGYMKADGIYRLATFVQMIFYGSAFVGMLLPTTRKLKLINFTYFFLVMNAAAVAGFWRWITGRCVTAWQPAYVKGPQ